MNSPKYESISVLDRLGDPQENFCNQYRDIYLREEQIKLHRYEGSLLLRDLTDAMATGKTCTEFKFDYWSSEQGMPMPTCLWTAFSLHDWNFRKIFELLSILPWERDRWGGWKSLPGEALTGPVADAAPDPLLATFQIHRSERKSVRVWSPFKSVPPLKHLPTKWTVTHVLRALLNGQFQTLKCNGVYTDDYAWDAAVDFQRGERPREFAWAFARRILEEPSGWYAHFYEGRVDISCHTFDNNSFIPDLTMRFDPDNPNETPAQPASEQCSVNSVQQKRKPTKRAKLSEIIAESNAKHGVPPANPARHSSPATYHSANPLADLSDKMVACMANEPDATPDRITALRQGFTDYLSANSHLPSAGAEWRKLWPKFLKQFQVSSVQCSATENSPSETPANIIPFPVPHSPLRTPHSTAPWRRRFSR